MPTLKPVIAALAAVTAAVVAACPAASAAAPAADSTPWAQGVCATSPGGPFDDILALTNDDGRWENFWVGQDRELYHQWQLVSDPSRWSAPVSLGGHLTGCIAGAVNDDGRLEIFGRAAGGDLDHLWQDNSPDNGWSGWASLGGSLTATNRPDEVQTSIIGDGLIEVCVYGADNNYHCKWQQPGAPGGWTPDWH